MEWENYITLGLHKSFSPLFNAAFDATAKALQSELLRKKFEWVASKLTSGSFLTREHTALLGQDDPALHEVALLASTVFAHQRDQKRAKTLPQKAGATGAAGGVSPWRQGLRRR